MNNSRTYKPYRTDLVQFCFRSNQRLAGEIKTLAEERHKSVSDTLRMLLDMGLDSYQNNELEGNTTRDKAQSAANLKRAQAQAKAAEREARKQGKKIVTSVTPLLFGSEEYKKLMGED